MEKKLAAVEKSSLLLTEVPVIGLDTKVNEKDLGKGAIILHMGQTGSFTTQVAMHRPIGSVPDALATDWAITPKSQIGTLLKANNPFEGKTQSRVSVLKTEYGLKAGFLIKNPAGEICYPNGSIREQVLGKCRELHDIHAKVEGGKPMKPIFSYATSELAKYEIAYLNSLANSEELKTSIVMETAPYREYETKDPVTGQSQVTMKWAKGIPAEQLPIVLMEVITTGNYDAAKWDKLKEEPPKKVTPFAIWGYVAGDIPADKLAELSERLREFAKIQKDYNLSVPQGQKAVQAESAEQKAQRIAKHAELQKAAHAVNEAERFEYNAHVPYEDTKDKPLVNLKGKNKK
jgi:hypothetical protein